MAAALSPRVAISALFALDGALLGGWMSHIPEAQHQHHLTTGQLGTTLLCSSLGALSAMSFSGTLIHRYGSRKVSIVCAWLVIFIIPFLLRAPSQGWLAFTLFLMGASNGTVDIAMNSHAMAIHERAGKPILSSVHGWWCIGVFIGGAGTAIANKLRFAPADHLIVASVLLAIVLVVSIPGLLPDDADRGAEGAKFALPKGRLLTLGLLTLLALFAEGALSEWSAVYFRDELRTDATIAALGFGIGAGSMALGRMVGDWFVHRYGAAWILGVSGLMTSGGLVLGVLWAHPIGAFLGFGLAGLGLANAVPILFAAAANVPGISSSAGIATVASMGYAAFLGGPPLIGNLAQATSLRFGLGLVGVMAVLIAIFGPRVLRSSDAVPRTE